MPAGLGKGPRVVTLERRKPLWLYPNLLSLDAPLVAMAWLYVFAETWRVMFLPWQAYVALGLVVWLIYVADRLLDGMLAGGGEGTLSARHEFHRKHRKKFAIGAVIAGVATPVLVFTSLPFVIIDYAKWGGYVVAAYFIISLFSDKHANGISYSKNILAGMAFAYGTAMLALLYTGFGIGELFRVRELVCFGALCIINISAIDLWEHADRSPDLETKAADELALILPLVLLGGAALLFALMDRQMSTRPFFYAILTGSALLYVLNRCRANLSMDSLRVLADVALLVPVLVFLAFPRE